MDYGYHYNYENNYPMSSGGQDIFEAVMSIYLILLTVVIIFALISYIFRAVGLYTMGKRMGRQYPWLAFIPYARHYYQGELAGEITLKNKSIKNPGIWNLVIPIISSVVAGVFAVLIAIAMGFGIMAATAGMRGLGFAAVFSILLYTLLIVVALALSAARITLRVLINKQILERFTTGNMPTVHAVLTIAVPMYEAFCFFVMRNREFNPGMEPKQTPPPAPIPPVYPEGPMPPANHKAAADPVPPADQKPMGTPVPPMDQTPEERPISPLKPEGLEDAEGEAPSDMAGPETLETSADRDWGTAAGEITSAGTEEEPEKTE